MVRPVNHHVSAWFLLAMGLLLMSALVPLGSMDPMSPAEAGNARPFGVCDLFFSCAP